MSESNLINKESVDFMMNSMSTTNLSPFSINSPLCITQSKMKLKKDAIQQVDLMKESQSDHKYKTELCKSWTENGFCAYGNKCRFAHGRNELFDKLINCKKYKQKECMSFFKNSYCCYGSRCHFKHEERDLNEIQRSFYSFLLEVKKTQFENLETKKEDYLVDNLHNQKSKIKSNRLPIFNSIYKQNIPSQQAEYSSHYLKSFENYSNQTRFTFNYCNVNPLF